MSEAAERLSLDPSRVRQLIRDGALAGRQVGRQWLIPAEDLARLAHQRRLPGRPLAPARAWGLLDLLDGGTASWLPPVARSQVRQQLRRLVGADAARWRSALRARSDVHAVVAHQAALARLEHAAEADVEVLRAGPGAAAAAGADLVVVEARSEFYVSEQAWQRLRSALHLREANGQANVVVRVPRGCWPFADRLGAAALAADLLESSEPRAVKAGELLLNGLAAGQPGAGR